MTIMNFAYRYRT